MSQFKALEKQAYSRMFSAFKKGTIMNRHFLTVISDRLFTSNTISILVCTISVDGGKDEKSAQTSVDLADEKKEVLVKRLRWVSFNSPWLNYSFQFQVKRAAKSVYKNSDFTARLTSHRPDYQFSEDAWNQSSGEQSISPIQTKNPFVQFKRTMH